MSLKTTLENDLKQAMKSGDNLTKSVIRMALSAMKLTEIEKGAALDDAGVMAILQKEIKSRRETIADAGRAGRADLAAASQAEIELLEKYLPQSLPPEELQALARQAIQEAGATSLREMGQVMKLLMPRLQGRATGDQASQVVRSLLG
jgi:uncharacterized protein